MHLSLHCPATAQTCSPCRHPYIAATAGAPAPREIPAWPLPAPPSSFAGTYWGAVSSPCVCETVEASDLVSGLSASVEAGPPRQLQWPSLQGASSGTACRHCAAGPRCHPRAAADPRPSLLQVLLVGAVMSDYTTVGYSLLLSRDKLVKVEQDRWAGGGLGAMVANERRLSGSALGAGAIMKRAAALITARVGAGFEPLVCGVCLPVSCHPWERRGALHRLGRTCVDRCRLAACLPLLPARAPAG